MKKYCSYFSSSFITNSENDYLCNCRKDNKLWIYVGDNPLNSSQCMKCQEENIFANDK